MADLVNQFGQVVAVPDEQVGQALQEGFSVATPEALKAQQLKNEYSGVGHAAGALASGVASGASLGLSDVAISALGGKEALQAYEQEYGALRTVGQIGGALLGAGKLGGGGLVMRGARALSAPARAAIGVGGLVERGLGSGLLGLTTRAAAEGALFGAGAGVSELAISDDPLTGEKVAASLLHGAKEGALFGAAGGFGLGLAGKAIGGLGRSIAGAGDAGTSGLVRAWDRAATLFGAESGSVSRQFARYGDDGMRGFEIATTADDILARAGDDVADGLTRVMATRDAVAQRFSGALKADQISRVVSAGNEAEAALASRAFLAETRSKLTTMLEHEAEFGGRGMLKKLEKKLGSVERKVEEAIAGDSASLKATAFEQLDSFKRDVGKQTRKLRRRVDRGGTSDEIASYGELDSLYERGRTFLEDESLWGGAGALQRKMNAPWAEHIPTNREFGSLFTRTKEGRFGQRLHEIDREKVGSYVASLRQADKSQSHSALRNWLDTTQEFVDAAEAMALPPAEKAAIGELATHTKALRGKLDEAANAIGLSNELKDLGGDSAASDVLGGVLGANVIGGPIGGAIGTVGSALLRPGGAIRRVASISRLARQFDVGIEGGVKGFFGRATKGAIVGLPRAGGTVERLLDRKERFAKREREVRMAAMDKAGTEERLRRDLAELHGVAPEATTAAASKLAGVNDYLLGKLPVAVHNGPGRAPAISRAEMDKFLRIDEAARDPLSIGKLLSSGKLTRDHVDTVRNLWPVVFSQMQDEAMRGLSELEADGKQLPYRERLQLGLLLDIPADPSLQPRLFSMLQGGYVQNSGGEMPGGSTPHRPRKAPNLSGSFRSGSEELTDGG